MSNDNNTQRTREIAKRVTLTEINGIEEFEQDEGDMATKYAHLPTGEKVNRVFVVGTLTELRELDSGSIMLTVVDNVGNDVKAFTGEYNLEAHRTAKQLLDEDGIPPEYVFIVGKLSESSNEDYPVPSISPEFIRTVSTEEINHARQDITDAVANRTVTEEVQRVIDENRN